MINSQGIGECLACTKLYSCNETSIEKATIGYTCPLFDAVKAAIFEARLDMITKYGNVIAIEAMLQRPKPLEEGEVILNDH